MSKQPWTSTSISERARSKGLLPVPGTPAYRDAWQKTIDAAEEANDPGRFWHSSASSGPRAAGQQPASQRHLPRRATKASQVEPFTAQKSFGSDNPRDLWKHMAAYEEKLTFRSCVQAAMPSAAASRSSGSSLSNARTRPQWWLAASCAPHAPRTGRRGLSSASAPSARSAVSKIRCSTSATLSSRRSKGSV